MKLRILLKSFNGELIKKASAELHNACVKANCQVAGIVALPIRIKKYCVLRSPHIDKDSREQFELRLHKHFLDLNTDSPSVLDSLLKMELPVGVVCSLKVLEV